MERIKVDVYGDYAWPWVYNAAVWLDRVKQVYKDDLDITWKNYSLEQNAHSIKQKEEGTESDWKVWEQDNVTDGRSLLSQIAAEAARRQGGEAYDKYHLALLTARHAGDGRIYGDYEKWSNWIKDWNSGDKFDEFLYFNRSNIKVVVR